MNKHIAKQSLLDALYAPYKDSHILLVEGGSNRIIFGEGDIDAKLMLIGEAPGATEDELMRPFVGRSGRLLNQVLEAVGTSREQTFITNIVKVRPPDNRKPFPQELARGRELLLKQIEIIKPKVICTLGASALEGLLGHQVAITGLRGKLMPFSGTLIMPTFHPAYILRDPNKLPVLVQDITRAIEAMK